MEAYPLQWPSGRPRTPMMQQVRSRFDMTPDRARRELRQEAERHGNSVVISANVELRRDGEPYAARREPVDTGVAVYFMRNERAVCFACDQYQHVWENMRAICKTLEAMRGIERWGSAEMLDRAFSGFEALPPPRKDRAPSWQSILGVRPGATRGEINDAWKNKCRSNGGATVELNSARDEAMMQCKDARP